MHAVLFVCVVRVACAVGVMCVCLYACCCSGDGPVHAAGGDAGSEYSFLSIILAYQHAYSCEFSAHGTVADIHAYSVNNLVVSFCAPQHHVESDKLCAIVQGKSQICRMRVRNVPAHKARRVPRPN